MTRSATIPKRLPRTRLPVADRAVLRWLQHHGFVDVETVGSSRRTTVREQIWRETREALNSGASRLTVNGTQYRMRGGMTAALPPSWYGVAMLAFVVTLVDRRQTGAALKWPNRRTRP